MIVERSAAQTGRRDSPSGAGSAKRRCELWEPRPHRIEIVDASPRWRTWALLALAALLIVAQLLIGWRILVLEDRTRQGDQAGAMERRVLLRGVADLRELSREHGAHLATSAGEIKRDLSSLGAEVARTAELVSRPTAILVPVPSAPSTTILRVEQPPAVDASMEAPQDITSPQPPIRLHTLSLDEGSLDDPEPKATRKTRKWPMRTLSGGLLIASAFLPARTPITFAQSRPVQRSVKKALGFNGKARDVADDVLDAAEDAQIRREGRRLERRRERRDNFLDGFLKVFVPGFD